MDSTDTRPTTADAAPSESTLGPGARGPGWPRTGRVMRERLEAALVAGGAAIEAATRQAAPPAPAVLASARARLADARVAGRQGRFYLAWDLVQQAERLLSPWLPEAQQQQRFRCLQVEALDKLGGWRRQAAEAVAQAGFSAEGLVTLLELVHQDSQNRQHKLALLQAQCATVLGLLAVALGLILAEAARGGYGWVWNEGLFGSEDLPRVLWSCLLVGLFGSLVSMCFRLADTPQDHKIPQLRSSFVVLTLRAVVGASAAVPLVFLVHSGLVQLGPAKVLVGASFLAGFSERWFVAMLDKAAR
ncbi:hypothetical protein LRM40_03405 [Ideonella dechloratans]|nr:hypothetical protein [Ideonella dechloratans]UFU10744.1 hypothetical protein LRM40_03405 [Ideonella dechloratans]